MLAECRIDALVAVRAVVVLSASSSAADGTNLRKVSELFGHRDRHNLARATLRNPDRIACRFDSGWCVESVL
jgi:hypothetical protein